MYILILLILFGKGFFMAENSICAAQPPLPPIVALPAGISTANPPRIEWRGESHEAFHLRITSGESPESEIIWDSGEMQSEKFFFTSSQKFPEHTTLFTWARARSAAGWSGWSARRAPFRIHPIEQAAGVLYTYDLRYTRALPAWRAFEHAHLAAALQGIANRRHPRLYVYFVQSELAKENVDEYWLRRMREPGCWLEKITLKPVGDIESLVKIFADEINGVVLWDPDVPATSNVASTAAGAENLLPIPKNPSPDSLYQRLISGKINLPVRLDLCNKFTGRSMIPDTNRTSTGSKKCDAYIWAMEKYLKTGLCNPLYQGYYIDSFWIKNPAPGHDFQNHTLTNHDYFISHKGFFWDLSVWADETPIDDPCQPLGSDFKILQEILAESLRLSNHRAFIHVGGFTPWAFKYTDSKGAGGRRGGVETEWETVRILSAYNAYIDADALHLSALANASVFQHLPLPSRYAQPLPPMEEELRRQGLLDEKGAPAAKTYLLHYVGDYDAAAWTVNSLFSRWDAPERGSLKMSWAVNPNLSERARQFFEYAYRTRTAQDVFISGDSGAGYVNVTQLLPPREPSGAPAADALWQSHCRYYYQKFGYNFTGFLINGRAGTITPNSVRMFLPFSRGGVVQQMGFEYAPLHLVENMPVYVMCEDLSGNAAKDAAKIHARAKAGETRFLIFRSVLKDIPYYQALNRRLIEERPDLNYVICDAAMFSYLTRLHLGGKNQGFASCLFDTLPPRAKAGEIRRVQIAVRNDGWDAWDSGRKLILEIRRNNQTSILHNIPLGRTVGAGDCALFDFELAMPEKTGLSEIFFRFNGGDILGTAAIEIFP